METAIMNSSRQLTMLLLCGLLLTAGCSRSIEAELAKARAEVEAARAEAVKARREAEGAKAALPNPADARKNEQRPKLDDLAKEHVYPGATKHGESFGGEATPAYLATFVTMDDPEKVTHWYTEKAYMQKISKDLWIQTDGIVWGGDQGVAVKHDTHQPADADGAQAKPRQVAVHVFTKRWDRWRFQR
jgi:hypothetical protein